jgi:hypothetical protein
MTIKGGIVLSTLFILSIVQSDVVIGWSMLSERTTTSNGCTGSNVIVTLLSRTNQPAISRRSFTETITRALLVTGVVASNSAHAAATTNNNKKIEDAIDELRQSRDKLKDIPDLLEAKEWDKVRSILKLPPVNKLWNLGDVRCYNFYFQYYLNVKRCPQGLTIAFLFIPPSSLSS